MISVKKVKSKLIFTEGDQTISYDIATDECISPKGNKVKTLNKYFRHKNAKDIIDSIKEEPYRLWFNFVRLGTTITNIGTILRRLKTYSKAEQLFSAGVTDIARHEWNSGLSKMEIPKWLIKKCRDESLYLDMPLVKMANLFGKNLFEKASNLLSMGHYQIGQSKNFIEVLINTHGYDLNLLIEYMHRLEIEEGVQNSFYEILDYARNACEVRGNWKKYPKNFLTTKHIIDQQYRLQKIEIDEKKFKKISEDNQKLTKKKDHYFFIYPTKPDEVIQEGVDQNHCVATYLNRVLSGSCHVLFMRENKNEPLVTVALNSDYTLQHAAGKYNRSLTSKEKTALNNYIGGL